MAVALHCQSTCSMCDMYQAMIRRVGVRLTICVCASACGRSTARPNSGPANGEAAAGADSKLLVRAAQRLLEDAQQDAQQVARSLTALTPAAGVAAGPAAASAARAARGRLLSNGNSCTGSRSTAAAATACAAAAAASVDDLRNSPLGTVLAQYKEAQAGWAQEKVSQLLFCEGGSAGMLDDWMKHLSAHVDSERQAETVYATRLWQ